MVKKKLLLFFIAMFLILINFSVKAEEYSPKFDFKGVKQDGEEIVPVNGVYSITSYSKIHIDFDLKDDNPKKMYYLINDGKYGSSMWRYSGYDSGADIYLDNDDFSDFDYNLKLCDSFECNEKYDELNLKFSFDLYEIKNNSKIYIEKVMQVKQLN